MINDEIVKVAQKYLNEREIPDNRGWYNKALEKAFKAVGWRYGQHWCAYTMELVWKEAYIKYFSAKIKENPPAYIGMGITIINGSYDAKMVKIFELLTKLCSGNSQKTFRNFEKSKDFQTGKEPKIGAAVVWRHNSIAGHTAACVTQIMPNGNFYSIEGNAGNKVSKKFHNFKETNRLGFIYPTEF